MTMNKRGEIEVESTFKANETMVFTTLQQPRESGDINAL